MLVVEAGQARDELDVRDLLLLDEGEDALGMRGHLRGEDRQDVYVHAGLAQQAHAAHDASVRGCAMSVGAHRVMQVAIGVDRDPDEKPVLAEERGPFPVDQIAVRLQRPAHLLALAALLHPSDEGAEEIQTRERGLAALEGEGYVGVRGDGEGSLYDRIGDIPIHDAGAALLAMRGNVAVKAIPATHVAGARRRFNQEADMLRAHGTRPLRTGSPSLRRPDTTTLPEGAVSGPHNRRRRLSRGPGALSARRGPHAPPGRAAADRSYAAPPHRPCRQGC